MKCHQLVDKKKADETLPEVLANALRVLQKPFNLHGLNIVLALIPLNIGKENDSIMSVIYYIAICRLICTCGTNIVGHVTVKTR